jgi:MarR-like DNA-binding transcriptional regulator SgrR of sgrS sRNA
MRATAAAAPAAGMVNKLIGGSFMLIAGILMLTNVATTSSTLKVGFPNTWGTLTPSLQHSAYADTIIKNQFEPLGRFGATGTIEPLAAKSWSSTDDFRSLTFVIDNSRRFSDGTVLTAHHFKAAWEHALSLQPKSANKSVQDLLYKVEGYDDFAKTGKLSGLIAKDDSTFEIHFRTPFRMALDRLCGGRFGVFIIKKDGRYLGTGSYVIEEQGERNLLLTRNQYAAERPAYERIEVSVVDPKNAGAGLEKGDIDAYSNASGMKECASSHGEIACLSGDEVQHVNLYVNGLQNRFFAKEEYRQALQALIAREWTRAEQSGNPMVSNLKSVGFRQDTQVFLPLQKGRLTEEEAQELVRSGERYISDFVQATKSSPIFYASRSSNDWIFRLLKDQGVTFTENSGEREMKALLEMGYKTGEPDLMLLRTSVANGDPDGVYHFMGKHGAILLPMTYRSSCGESLEEGRAILDKTRLDSHYQKVARAVLKDVPFVHLGFDRDILAYRKDRVRIVEQVRERKDFRFIIFEPL